MEINKKWLNYLGVTLLAIIVFVTGFYYGFRYHEANTNPVNLSEVKGVADAITNTEIVTKEIPGVYWIKPGQDPNCPQDYPIKGKFDSNVCFFYTKENQSYSRVKAHVCFASEEFAETSVGCIKKF